MIALFDGFMTVTDVSTVWVAKQTSLDPAFAKFETVKEGFRKPWNPPLFTFPKFAKSQNCGDAILCKSFHLSTEKFIFSPFSYKNIKDGPIWQQEYTVFKFVQLKSDRHTKHQTAEWKHGGKMTAKQIFVFRSPALTFTLKLLVLFLMTFLLALIQSKLS